MTSVMLTLWLVSCDKGLCYKNYRFDVPSKNVKITMPYTVTICKTGNTFPTVILSNYCEKKEICQIVTEDEDGITKALVNHSCERIRQYAPNSINE